MIGRSTSTGSSVAAAKQIIKKAVFCVDNVGTSFKVEDIRSFVSSMAIDVVSCFEVKPRRRRNEGEDEAADRKAFRLCICADDRESLLDASKWPNSITVSDWFFKSRAQPAPSNDKRPRLDTSHDDDDDAVMNTGGTSGVRRQSVSTVMEHDDNDETIPLDTSLTNLHTSDGGIC